MSASVSACKEWPGMHVGLSLMIEEPSHKSAITRMENGLRGRLNQQETHTHLLNDYRFGASLKHNWLDLCR